VAALAFERGVWLLAGSGGQADGTGDYLVLGPPLVASEDDLRSAVDVVAGALDTVRASLDR
jgi:adenosylmethionine-8-amino-7-oxononanoate aminotransferase